MLFCVCVKVFKGRKNPSKKGSIISDLINNSSEYIHEFSFSFSVLTHFRNTHTGRFNKSKVRSVEVN
jgi:hypothetical protein